ncbi:MAG: ABC transporter substrate-binding protein [Geminicoccaceae bacterium]|nr:MAG: ABC transporter substrate-binding protein [Geminicoccaceae bacterium]
MIQSSRRTFTLTATVAALAALLPARPAAAVEPDAAHAFISELAERATAILQSDTSRAHRREELRQVLHEGFDIPFVARTVLGAPYRDLTDSQRQAYIEAFERWVVASYADRLDDYEGQALEIVRADSRGERDAVVVSRVVGQTPEVRIDWRVRELGGHLRIIDIEVEGVSMAVSQRSEFGSVVQRRGIEGLITLLEERAGPLT